MFGYYNPTEHVLRHKVSQSLESCADIRSEALVTGIDVTGWYDGRLRSETPRGKLPEEEMLQTMRLFEATKGAPTFSESKV